LSGGKLNTVMANFLSFLFLTLKVDHFIALSAITSTLSWSVCALPVASSRPERIIGSIAPSSSGIAI